MKVSGEGTFPTHLLIASGRSRLMSIAGKAYLFIEENQSLSALNADAASIWSAFEQGVICRDLTPRDTGLCNPSMISDLLSVGAIEPLSTEEDICLVDLVQVVDTAHARIGIGYEDVELADFLGIHFAHMNADPGPCDDFISVQRDGRMIGISLRDGPVAWAAPNQAAPLLKIAITDLTLKYVKDLLLHVALLEINGRAMLLVGGPGAGKSTLATALGSSGAVIAGDDLASINIDGLVRALPFPITLKSGSWDVLCDRQADIDRASTHHRPDNQWVRYLPLDSAATAAPLPVGWIVFLDRVPLSPPTIAPVSVPETLSGLIGSAWSGTEELTIGEFESLATCVDSAICIRLTYSDLGEAVIALMEVCDAEAAIGPAYPGHAAS